MINPIQVRAGLLDFLRRELIGPDPRVEHCGFNAGEEILRPQDPPRLRYSAGVLFPERARIAEAETASKEEAEAAESGPPEGEGPEDLTEDGVGADAETNTEQEVNRANDFLPSAMGLTALVRMSGGLKVFVRAGRYERKAQEGLGKVDKEGNWQPHHWRRAVLPPPVDIDCSDLMTSARVTKEYALDSGDPALKLAMHVFSRPYARAGSASDERIVTFTLINRTEMSGKSPRDTECFFQSEFSVNGSEGEASFLEYPDRTSLVDDDEEQSLRLLHRNEKTFAIGHGCAATWRDTDAVSVEGIGTDALPAYEIKPVLPRELPGLALKMRVLADVQDPAGLSMCAELAAAYLSWIEEQERTIDHEEFPSEYRATARGHLVRCRECHQRILSGIRLVRTDDNVRKAFAWMNRAMLLQQLHYDLASNHRRTWEPTSGGLSLEREYKAPDPERPPPGKGRWRAFQLAFILMNLNSVADRRHPERAIVDLIWFPTGGGKTEAYLGLAAFTLLLRRLKDPADDGTTVLMRYSLRLLTTQQFQRAASLVCACEILRRSNPGVLGASRISIGLWVGLGVTPNKNRDALTALNSLLRNGKPNPFVLLACPWCGAEMGPVGFGDSYKAKGYRRDSGAVVFRCEDPHCDFSTRDGLPLFVVDEAIYLQRPTLVIGTLDKFALLPWYPEARSLFGLGTLTHTNPPDVIIQDELHLVSGPLGSMVGMYESTIDALCSTEEPGERRGVAKIIASTATICRAQQQVHSLYARSTFLFPPQGLRTGDSFFAQDGGHDFSGGSPPGRLYVGVFGSALSSHVTAQVRVISALLQGIKCLPVANPDLLDPYWTLMVYFNSLRELGHAATLVRADIREHMNATWDRLGIRKPPEGAGTPDVRRFINRDLELTSRIQSDAVTDVLQQLFNGYPGSDERRPVDVCLATNMIQVGLDVPRLGLMVVVGQPKTTSEYIQATSRVGRDTRGPGLVVTVFNPAKPRDRSHYEHFRSYHQSMYRWVEPTSVTPFAVPVRERALHAQLITLARYWGDTLLRERPTPPPTDALYSRIRDVLIRRIEQVDPEESQLGDEMLRLVIERWRAIQPPIYGHFGLPPDETPLMFPAGSEPRAVWCNRSTSTPASMRNVDAGCDAEVIRQFPGRGPDAGD
jgi:hypothetical protein